MKKLLQPYANHAKVAIGVLSTALIAFGVYDESTMIALVGTTGAVGAAFWALYDAFVGEK